MHRIMIRLETGEEQHANQPDFPTEEECWQHVDAEGLANQHPECTFFVEPVTPVFFVNGGRVFGHN